MIVGWMGSVTNALGMTYELRVIASAVIGGADLMGGVGTAYGALIGSILVELIRSRLMEGMYLLDKETDTGSVG